ncbi:MAG: methyltransferase [Burkholderiales bacterium RIFCSPLOWO2_12_67_14]|nr:MAG: methyltransferase [Burkholderiales bacterium RIFCSPLOWO2_02_FULL_67_64]OGB44465.1 MAG: methyltransferase [Burkholderiales bacterium RIFCSPHIGHO2_12_FULL_67_38]OGB50517.1 MAG: methyltransferase [Burkholderiales bacterium RIFCSPLOWO2_12_67_14]OGB78691.1 MAG: methyltransferase [Burkholderiales bacterium RIFCSPLOWO2_12_FULL_67_210]
MSVLDIVVATLRAEFSDLLQVEQAVRVTARMAVALLLGAVIGWDRERRDADAGLRTHMLVSLGAALFVLVPAEAGMGFEALSRVVQGVVSGIGFLGAGAVLKMGQEGRVHGLTTAATIWTTAAVGLSAGLGREGTALLATAFILLVLVWLRRLEVRKRRQDSRVIASPDGGQQTPHTTGRNGARD